MSEYKAIQITKPEEQEAPLEIKVEVPITTEDEQEPVEAVPVAKPEVDKKEVKRRSRAAERIEQLLQNQRELEHRLELERSEKVELKKQVASREKTNKEDLKASLDIAYATLSKQLSTAIKEADVEATVSIQDKMMDVKMKQSELSRELKSEFLEVPAESPKDPIRSAQPKQPKVPQAALDWIEDHPMFKTDELFYNAAMTINNQLLRENFDAEDPDFYEELSSRLIKRFPDAFSTEEENGVQLSNKITPSGNDGLNEQPDVKPKNAGNSPEREPRPSRSPNKEQVVSGSSRPSATQVQQAKSNSVTLTQEQVLAAEQSGISLETMARRVKHIEENKRPDGYTPIIIKRS